MEVVEVAGIVQRRRPRSKELVFLDTAVEDDVHGSQLVSLILSSELLGPLRDHPSLTARAGDCVRARGTLLLAQAVASAAELRCGSLAIESKWDHATKGAFIPRALPTTAPVEGEARAEGLDEDPAVPLCVPWLNTGRCTTQNTTCVRALGMPAAQLQRPSRPALRLNVAHTADPHCATERQLPFSPLDARRACREGAAPLFPRRGISGVPLLYSPPSQARHAQRLRAHCTAGPRGVGRSAARAARGRAQHGGRQRRRGGQAGTPRARPRSERSEAPWGDPRRRHKVNPAHNIKSCSESTRREGMKGVETFASALRATGAGEAGAPWWGIT